MDDAALRALVREWRETGSEEAGECVLADRLRRGEVNRSRLVIAALCGSSAASRVSGSPLAGQATPTTLEELALWCFELNDALRGEGRFRFHAALCTVVYTQIRSEVLSKDAQDCLIRCRKALHAAEFWFCRPGDRTRRHAEGRFERVHRGPGRGGSAGGQRLEGLVKSLGPLRGSLATEGFTSTSPLALISVWNLGYWRDQAEQPDRRVWDAVRGELCAWATGDQDPIRERVAERTTSS